METKSFHNLTKKFEDHPEYRIHFHLCRNQPLRMELHQIQLWVLFSNQELPTCQLLWHEWYIQFYWGFLSCHHHFVRHFLRQFWNRHWGDRCFWWSENMNVSFCRINADERSSLTINFVTIWIHRYFERTFQNRNSVLSCVKTMLIKYKFKMKLLSHKSSSNLVWVN